MSLRSDDSRCAHWGSILILSALMLLSCICSAHAASNEHGLISLVQSSLTEVLGAQRPKSGNQQQSI